MKLALVGLRETQQVDGNYKYWSYVLKSDGNPAPVGQRNFVSREEMLAVMNPILATQAGSPSVNQVVLDLMQSSGGYQWAGVTALDLTDEQAAALGWKG